jgi:hypothetical protein
MTIDEARAIASATKAEWAMFSEPCRKAVMRHPLRQSPPA